MWLPPEGLCGVIWLEPRTESPQFPPIPCPSYPIFPLPCQDQGKSEGTPTSLKQQMTVQDFSGAVAVIAIVYRPAPLQNASSASGCLPTGIDGRKKGPDGPPFDSPEQGPPQKQPVFLHVANVGDCRAVLCRAGKAVVLTRDHTPSVPSEAARVEAAGGFVSRCRVNGILGVSRSFGDIHCKVGKEATEYCRINVVLP